MTDKIRYPDSVIMNGVEYKRGDRVPMIPKRKLKVRPAHQQFVEIKKRT